MHVTPLSATLLAVCILGAGAGQAGPAGGVLPIEQVTLNCPDTGPDTGGALADRLCAALRQRLAAMPRLGEPLELTLQVHSPRPDILRARLVAQDGTGRRDGPQLELTAMDRATIPDSQIQALARLMLDQAIPSHR